MFDEHALEFLDQGRFLGGGGSNDPDASVFTRFLVQLGLLMGFTAVLAIILHFLRQSSIVSYILVGIIMKHIFADLDVNPDTTTLDHFSHLGIIMLLFMAGLEVDIPAFLARAKLVSIVGFGQIFINTLVGMITGVAIVNDMLNGVMGLVYFGLCCTFSSTIVVLGMLKERKQLEALHGQICLGLLVFQDITAVMSLAILTAATKKEEYSECSSLGNSTIDDEHRFLGSGGNETVTVEEEETNLALSLLFLMLWLCVFSLLQFLSSKYVLHRLFRELSSSGELLYLGTLGYALFSAGVADAVGFSAEIAAFLAGVSMTVLPYKLEIEDKVESLKNLGVVTFFITLGMDLELDIDPSYYLASFIAATVTLFCTMGIVVLLGFLARMQARPTFMIGGIVNQISEFSLILASLCVERGVFCKDVLTILTLACVITIIFSGIGHGQLENGWEKFGKRCLSCLDSRARELKSVGGHAVELKDHVVCFGINKFTKMVAEYAVEKLGKKHILVVSLDANKMDYLQGHPIIKTLYADMFDPDTWDHVVLESAQLVVSVLEDGQEAEISMGRYMKQHGGKAFFMCATESDEEALELYEGGIDFVIHTERLAVIKLTELLTSGSLDRLANYGEEHKKRLKDQTMKDILDERKISRRKKHNTMLGGLTHGVTSVGWPEKAPPPSAT